MSSTHGWVDCQVSLLKLKSLFCNLSNGWRAPRTSAGFNSTLIIGRHKVYAADEKARNKITRSTSRKNDKAGNKIRN
jgi:hypothetical protein